MKIKIFGAALVIVYLCLRYGLTAQVDAMGPYTGYLLELMVVAFSLAVFRRHFFVSWRLSRGMFIQMFASLLLGGAIAQTAKYLDLPIPFDPSNKQTVAFLLLLGPVLEEFIFRFALWHSFLVLGSGAIGTWLLTSALFSYGHFHSYFFVPGNWQGFIIFQTLYTLAAGLWWGWSYKKTGNLAHPIVLHIVFNLGFFLAMLP